MKKYLFIFIIVLFVSNSSCANASTISSKKEAQDVFTTWFKSSEVFRLDTYKQIVVEKNQTEKDIASMEKANVVKNAKILDATEKPIAYIKFYFLVVFAFVFGSKNLFYIVAAFLAFIILRFLYRKIRNR